VFARVATGGIRHRPMVERSGAVRADCPAVLTGRAHRATHCVRFALCVQTGAMRMTAKRAVRAALPAPLLGAPQWACAGCRLSRRWASGAPCTQDQSPKPGVYLALRQPAAWLRRPMACLDDFSGAGKSKNRWTGLSLLRVLQNLWKPVPATGLRDSVDPQRSTTSVTVRKPRVHRSQVLTLPGIAPKQLHWGDSPGWEALQPKFDGAPHRSRKSGQKREERASKTSGTRMPIGFTDFLGSTA
jgi:hypothetical protein